MTQTDEVLHWLKRRKHISPFDAFVKLKITRLAARIYDLRKEGHEILTDTSEGYARYSLVKTL